MNYGFHHVPAKAAAYGAGIEHYEARAVEESQLAGDRCSDGAPILVSPVQFANDQDRLPASYTPQYLVGRDFFLLRKYANAPVSALRNLAGMIKMRILRSLLQRREAQWRGASRVAAMLNQLAKNLVCEENRLLASVAGAGTVHEVCFSPDGTAVAFIASSSGRYMVQDAKATRSTYDLAENLVVGPMGETSARRCTARREADDRQEFETWPSLFVGRSPVLGVDGQTVAYCATSPALHRSTGHAPGGSFIVVGERLIGPFEDAGNQIFNPVTGDPIASVRDKGRRIRHNRCRARSEF